MSTGSLSEIVASWPEPNYVDPETRGNGVIVVSVLFGLLGTIVTALRLLTRLYITRTFGLDDWFIIVAWVSTLSPFILSSVPQLILTAAQMSGIAMFIVMSIASAQWGWNRHIWDIPFPIIPQMLQSSLAFFILFGVSSGFTKLSLLWFCRRILGDGRKIGVNYYNLACILVMIIVGGFVVSYTIIEFLQCRYASLMATSEPFIPFVSDLIVSLCQAAEGILGYCPHIPIHLH